MYQRERFQRWNKINARAGSEESFYQFHTVSFPFLSTKLMQRVTNPRNRESLFLSFAHQIYLPLLENSSSRFHEILRQTTRCRGRAEWPERGNKRQNSSWSLVFHSSQDGDGWRTYEPSTINIRHDGTWQVGGGVAVIVIPIGGFPG